jgi:hypothetical protein
MHWANLYFNWKNSVRGEPLVISSVSSEPLVK